MGRDNLFVLHHRDCHNFRPCSLCNHDFVDSVIIVTPILVIIAILIIFYLRLSPVSNVWLGELFELFARNLHNHIVMMMMIMVVMMTMVMMTVMVIVIMM